MKQEELRRLEDLLRRDKALISEQCEAAAVRDFAHVAQEYFDLDGRVSFSLCEEKNGAFVTLTFRITRVKNFTVLP